MQFEFLPPPSIIFGKGKFQEIGGLLQNFGSQVLVVGSESALKTANLEELLASYPLEFATFVVKGEPTIELIDRGVSDGFSLKTQVVMGLGGGSTLDAGKAIAGLLTNGGSARDYMEVIGKGLPIKNPPLPYIAVPTTAGTGTEVTKNAVIKSIDDRYKASIRSPLLVPKIALIDANLMISVPSNITASTGLDALTQLIEAYTSNKSQPITDALALLGIKKCRDSLMAAYYKSDNLQAREDMALAALLSGICLANAGLGAVHGFASPLGGLFPIPHGVVCAALLAAVVEQNIKALQQTSNQILPLEKYAILGELVMKTTFQKKKDAYYALITYLRQLTTDLDIPPLSSFGLTESDFSIVIENTKNSSSFRYNPIPLNDEALSAILQQVI